MTWTNYPYISLYSCKYGVKRREATCYMVQYILSRYNPPSNNKPDTSKGVVHFRKSVWILLFAWPAIIEKICVNASIIYFEVRILESSSHHLIFRGMSGISMRMEVLRLYDCSQVRLVILKCSGSPAAYLYHPWNIIAKNIFIKFSMNANMDYVASEHTEPSVLTTTPGQ